MREILFRAKGKGNRGFDDIVYNGKWLTGDLVHEQIGKPVLMIQAFEDYLLTVDAETVGQYTGVTDKNGTKIFEGDIVKHDFTGEVDIIAWVDGSLVSKDLKSAFVSVIYKGFAKHLTVLGNIHDNPELLEVKG